MNRKLLITAVATAMCAPALAAFDDQGMEYISASEGLSGSMRINIFKDSDVDNSGVESDLDSLRIYYTGSSDLGGGLRSTYYWELREGNDDGSNVNTEAYDLGLTGPFGSFNVGKLGGVAPRLVPGGSLDAAVGSEHANYSPDPGANGLRYESVEFNGFRFGLSGELADGPEGDPNLDGFNAAVNYVHPIGLQLGFGYETEACWNGGFDERGPATNAAGDAGGPAFIKQDADDDLSDNVAAPGAKKCVPNYDDKSGFRFGGRYGQDNWLLAYEFRSHDNFDGNLGEAGYGTIVGDVADAHPTDASGKRNSGFYNNRNGTSYTVHRVAAQVKLDKLTFSANFSVEETEVTDDFGVTADTTALSLGDKRAFGRDKIGIDVSYALGSKSSIILGWGSTEAEEGNDEVAADNSVTQGVRTVEVAETLLRYRVDF